MKQDGGLEKELDMTETTDSRADNYYKIIVQIQLRFPYT